MILIRVLFIFAVGILLLVVTVALMTFGARFDCAKLVADGYAVVQVESNCYVAVSDGVYLQVYVHEQPKPLWQIIAEVEAKKNKPILSFP